MAVPFWCDIEKAILCRVPREARFPSNRVARDPNDVNVGFAPLGGPGNSRYSIYSSAVIGNGVEVTVFSFVRCTEYDRTTGGYRRILHCLRGLTIPMFGRDVWAFAATSDELRALQCSDLRSGLHADPFSMQAGR